MRPVMEPILDPDGAHRKSQNLEIFLDVWLREIIEKRQNRCTKDALLEDVRMRILRIANVFNQNSSKSRF